jgi:cytochrome c peroxidase
MKTKAHFSFIALATILLAVWGCEKESQQLATKAVKPAVKQGEYDYLSMQYPRNLLGDQADPSKFPNGINQSYPLTNEVATLGRVLFYDENLSRNNRISCGSCHVQSKGFADPAQFSTGHEFGMTTRNSMALSNVSLLRSYFWDSRARNLEDQVLMPVKNHVEMGIEYLEKLPKKLAGVDYYAPLFEAAFGDPAITENSIRLALAQFLRTMVSGQSKYDEGATINFVNYTPLEKMGLELFTAKDSKAKCGNCHTGELFNTNSSWGLENIGLDSNPTDHNGRFKVPSLRNIAVTAPYMHDGRLKTLEEVVDHYDHGIQMNSWLSWHLRDYNGPIRLNLTDLEKKALVAFLKTLTDEQFLKDPKYSDPFK